MNVKDAASGQVMKKGWQSDSPPSLVLPLPFPFPFLSKTNSA